MADPKGISPPTPHAETGSESPAPRGATLGSDADPEDTPSLNVSTLLGLKAIGAVLPKQDEHWHWHWHKMRYGGTVPKTLTDGAQKAVKEFHLPPSHRAGGTDAPLAPAEIFGSDYPDLNPNRLQFNIPGYGGKWALSVDRKFIGEGPGQVSAERWANVAKKLGQPAPLARPATPH